MTDRASSYPDTQLLHDPLDLPLMDSLRALWRGCIEHARRGATPEEWALLTRRLAELERRLPN